MPNFKLHIYGCRAPVKNLVRQFTHGAHITQTDCETVVSFPKLSDVVDQFVRHDTAQGNSTPLETIKQQLKGYNPKKLLFELKHELSPNSNVWGMGVTKNGKLIREVERPTVKKKQIAESV